MIFWFQMIPHLQSIKVIPKFLLENSCTASFSSKTSGYSFLRDKAGTAREKGVAGGHRPPRKSYRR